MQVTTALKWATPTRHPHRVQRNSRLFMRLGKEEALTHIRSMLDDPTLCYQTIAQQFGVTRQRIAQIAAAMGVDGRRCQLAFWRGRRLVVYVLPVCELQAVSGIWLPYTGRYAGGNNKKPKRDWTAYEDAWDKLNNLPHSRS